jgi:alkaline phosphatase D
VENDCAAEHSQDDEPAEAFLLRRAAAYQAYYEHMPLRPTARPIGPDMTLYTTLTFGDLASFMMLDNRQYGSDQACPSPEEFRGQLLEDCGEREQEDRSMLGSEQERWLRGELAGTTARWKVIGQQMLMAQLEQKQGEGEAWRSDGWDGYPAARQRLLAQVAEQKIENVVVIGGDIHSFWVSDLKRDFRDPASPTVATEVVGTSVTSEGVPYERFSGFLPENPHIRFFESRERGYVLAEVGPGLWRTELRAVDTVTRRKPRSGH